MLRRRTSASYKVVQYLFLVAISKNKRKERRQKEISRAAGVDYYCISAIIWRLQKDGYISIEPGKYEYSDANCLTPHSIVSVSDRDHARQLAKKLRWFHQ